MAVTITAFDEDYMFVTNRPLDLTNLNAINRFTNGE